jgi:hypothetical protein
MSRCHAWKGWEENNAFITHDSCANMRESWTKRLANCGKLANAKQIFRRMADVPERFANDRVDRRLVERKFSCRANVQMESSPRPTQNRFAYFAPLRLDESD